MMLAPDPDVVSKGVNLSVISAELDPALEARLMDAMADPGQFAVVRALFDACLLALTDFSQMDESLFERLSHGEGRLLDDANPAAALDGLRTDTLRGLRVLLDFLDSSGFLAPPDEDVAGSDDMDFDLGEGRVKDGDLGLDDLDIDGALSSLSPSPPKDVARTSQQDFARVVGTIGYGLKSQVQAFQERFLMAMQGNHFRQAMEDLDDTRNATADGVFALVNAVCEAYAPGVRPDGVVPGYKSTLQKALLVRRGLSDLTRAVDRENWFLQDKSIPPAEQHAALERLRRVLTAFLASDVFLAMRPADRWEMVKVQRALEGQPLASLTRQTCEGLSKYLESLSSINQREALRRHDTEVLKELRQDLEAARPLLDISASTASSLVQQSLMLAQRLYGRARDLDALLVSWRLTPPDLNHAQELEDVITQLGKVINQTGS
jgi:hypothetical protein